MNNDGKEAKAEKNIFLLGVGEYVSPYRGQFTLSIIISPLAVICGLAIYGVVGKLCGEIFEGGRTLGQLLFLIGIAGLCKALNAVLLNLSNYISYKASSIRQVHAAAPGLF